MSNLFKKMFSLVDRNKTVKDSSHENGKNSNTIGISRSIKDNRKYVESFFSNCFDIVIREVSLSDQKKKKALIVYLDGLSEKKLIEDFLISKLTSEISLDNASRNEIPLLQCAFGIKDNQVHDYIEQSIKAVLSGNTVFFVDGLEKSFEVNLNTPPGRPINEPNNEVVIRGPREGFTESLLNNVNLIRKKIKNPNLKAEKYIIGKETSTNIVICYLSNVTDKKIVDELKQRLENIDLESVLDSNFIEEFISDAPLSIFPLVFRTEKPDIAAAKILDGRIIIIVDGSPIVLSVPALFTEFIQSSEDYYIRFSSSTLNRYIRYISLFITITLPSIYVALTTFHQELIPTKLLISIINARAGVPFPAIWECFFMLTIFEIMREAGVRMPRALGQAISIVGGFVLGDAAVKAGLIGTPMVVIVSLTAITKFTVSSIELELPLVYVRILFLLLSGFLGLTGLIFGFLLVGMRLVSIRSFGIPYMFPICPFNMASQEDLLIRAPTWKLNITRKYLKIKNNYISKSIRKHYN